MLKLYWRLIFKTRYVTAPIYFVCLTKFLNLAVLFGSYFCCVGLCVIVFFNFCTFSSTPYFVFLFNLGSTAIGRFNCKFLSHGNITLVCFVNWVKFQICCCRAMLLFILLLLLFNKPDLLEFNFGLWKQHEW